jgi:hypothetical protein
MHYVFYREEQLKREVEAGEKGAHLLTNRLAQTEARLLEAEVRTKRGEGW